jgi:hypothetical protein
VNKLDSAVAPVSVDGTIVSTYFGMSLQRKALFIVLLGAIAATETVVLQAQQALDADGTNVKDITDAIVTVTANTNTTIAQLAIVTAAGGVHVAGQTVTINGLVFTAAAADVLTTRTYAVGSSGADSAAALIAKINSSDENIGVPDVVGVASVVTTNSVITLSAEETGEVTITAEASDSTTIVSTVEAIAYVEVDAAALDVNNDFSHVSLEVTTSAAILTSCTLVRDHSRYTADQTVAGSIVVVN